MSRKREIRIGSSPDEMYRVEQFVEDISDEHLLYGNYYSNILMAVTEAVQNGMMHGNKMDKQKRIHIIQESSQEGLWVRVQDEGAGFEHSIYSSNMDIVGEIGSEKNGLFLIHKLADEVKFRDNGRLIEMLFRINGIEEGIFERRMDLMQDFFRVYQRLSI